ncbi:MAG: HlyC/CorC family transporter [Clostridia bacterium]|jgi:putative hemolysin|nr:HlyC/CorC family transporter [Clostridia bacterium]
MQILIIVILILLNAFFASAEIAFISLNDAKIDKQAKEGNKKAKKIKDMLVNPSKFLATIQIGITLAGFLSSAFAAETFASELAPILNDKIPQIGLAAWNNISIILITIILSYFTLIFGELVPKRLAMKNCEKIAFASIGIIKTISVVTAPFVKFLTFSTNIVSKLFGVSENEEETVTEEEIRMMVDVGEEKGTIDKSEKNMINRVFEFNDKVVSEIMIPRTDIFALDMNMSISEVIEELSEDLRYSRVPVYEENVDNIKGIVYIKDILLSKKDKKTRIRNLMKEAYFVPETKRINELFDELRKHRRQIAIVVDEYGGTSGIVTIEDILEEIVGEIYDEYDEVEKTVEKIDETTYLLNGNIAIYEVEDYLNISIEEGEYDTLSGYLVEKLGRIPNEKDKGKLIETEKVIYKLEKIEDKHIEKVKACIIEKPEEEEISEE